MNLKKKNTKKINRPPFFIIGVPRSGTTLLQLILNQHSQLSLFPESNIFQTLTRLEVSSSIKDEWTYDYLLQTTLEWVGRYRTPAKEIIEDLLHKNQHYPVPTKRLLNTVITSYLHKEGKIFFGEKTPRNVKYISTIYTLFPEARLIFLIRNPMDIVCSLAKAYSSFYNKNENDDYNLLKAAYFIKKDLSIIVSRKGKSKNHIYVRYEDLAANPNNTLIEICNFLMIEFEEQMVGNNYKNYLKGMDIQTSTVHQILQNPVNQNSINKYKQTLRKNQIKMIYHFLKPEINQLGYRIEDQHTNLRINQKLWTFIFRAKYAISSFDINEKILIHKLRLKRSLNIKHLRTRSQ